MFRTHQHLTYCSLLIVTAFTGSACEGSPLTIGSRATEEGGAGGSARAGTSPHDSEQAGSPPGESEQAGSPQGGSEQGGTGGSEQGGGTPETGGAASGGTAPAAGGAATGGAAPETAGQGGAEPNDCGGGIRYTYPDCGSCVQTVEEHCGEQGCPFDNSQMCGDVEFYGTWERGCGYVRHRFDGDVGDHRVEIWDASSGRLVYSWDNGARSMGCYAETTVGTEPQCAEWTDACASDVCAGLQGEWTVEPVVTELEPQQGMADLFPAVGKAVGELGVRFWAENEVCNIEWRPVWGRSGAAPLSDVDGGLATAILEEAETGWCDWFGWQIDQIVVTPGSAPIVRLSNTVAQLTDDMVYSASVQAAGSPTADLPAVELRGAASPAEPSQPCLDSGSPETVVSVLPWSQIFVGSSQPLDALGEHLVASLDDAPLELEWSPPSDTRDASRFATAQLMDWERFMGKGLRVAVDSTTTPEVVFSILAPPSASAFMDEGLDDLVTQGTRELDTSSGEAKLHLTGSSCSEAVYAAGILEVSGKSMVWFELEVDDDDSVGATVEIIHTDGTHQLAGQTLPVAPNPRRYYAELNGDTTVGVYVGARGGCQAVNWSMAEIRIVSIEAE